MEIFVELSLILLVVSLVSIVSKFLKQPLIVGFIFSGIIVGPYVLNILKSSDSLEFFSKIGITILLFIVGLGLNPKLLKEVGKISLVTGVGQVVFTSLIGFWICRLLGFDQTSSIYISIALTFSSTIIILKLLTDKNDTDSLYGKISIGFLLVQDLIATLILIAVSSMSSLKGESMATVFFTLALKGVGITLFISLLAHTVLPKILNFVSKSQELLFIFSMSWGVLLAAIFYKIGFSIEIGALIAGVVLSSSSYAFEISSRIKPLRDFFVLLFFVLLGSQISITDAGQIISPAIILSLFVLIGNPVIVIILMNLLGYKRKTGFMAGLTVAQISEFSLILVSLGVTLGHVTNQTLSLVTLVGLFTIAGSSYLIQYSDFIYKYAEKLLKLLEFRKIHHEKALTTNESPEIILFGYDRMGSDFVEAIKKLNQTYLVVDYNPHAVKKLKEQSIDHAYGDADDMDFLSEIGYSKAKLVISTIPNHDTNMFLAKQLHKSNPHAISIVISHHAAQALELYKNGASYVLTPLYIGAQYMSHMLGKHGLDYKNFAKEREEHIKTLQKRIAY